MTITLEEKIKAFVRSQGVDVVGVAGPDRLDGPPSLDPTYTMKGAKSIVSMAVPMDGEAIHDWLGKKTPITHHMDQYQQNQRMYRISEMVAGYIRSLGYKAAAVPPNGSYRRDPYVFSVHPSFSHRFGAIAAGIAANGWSGNVMTEEYGGATYLATVVTDAVLTSDPQRYSPRHFIDGWCRKCRVCDKVCLLGMFIGENEEYLLINGELHPRAKRRDINMCNGSCFGLHSVSNDKKWTTWGYQWTKWWMDVPMESLTAVKLIPQLFARAMASGDAGRRYAMIRAFAGYLHPEEPLEEYLSKHPEKMSHEEHVRAYQKLGEGWGVKGLQDDTLLTCGNCGSVCGPTVEESIKRYRLLMDNGLVVRTADGTMKKVSTYEEAAKVRRLPERTLWQRIVGAIDLLWVFHKWYFGLEPKSLIQDMIYQRKAKKAVKDRVKGHKEYVEPGTAGAAPQAAD